ncbi:sugar-transfer associated ATP-grasp domain-containing protein [Roseisalinus antarcticus]|uniref:Alpha-L-glutamate ligase-related protein ATP-grasp domain-containing protein n=1 Tax=Roseisalinus antarcticus TaxID=254357 RepID=A0A1Y5TNB5_9RHOB|nr:sugar-transfer associated ATP-grasp domain-containing protein [Roseisalinus antarcticus]SLN64293.1 hypothetical protein ROA7023_03004 [Roseisalinus antarcticus]
MSLSRRIRSGARSLAGHAVAARRLRLKQTEARHALARLATRRGPLDRGLDRAARDYAGDVLGGVAHAPWLQVYAAMQGRFVEGWIPDSYYIATALARVNGDCHHLARHRTANHAFFGASGFPDVACVVNGRLVAPDYGPLSASDLGAAAEASGGLVFKPDHSAFGRGIRFLAPDALDIEALRTLGNGVLQRRVVADPALTAFGSAALPTLRVCTVVAQDGGVSARACYLKLGRQAETHVISASQVRVPIDLATGAFAAEGVLADWLPVAAHPDSGIAFAGHLVPGIAACIQTACDLHGRLPLARYVCWDLVPEAGGGVAVLEWEGGVVNFAEATQGPCFADLGWDRFHHG